MNRRKLCLIVIIGLAIMLSSLFMACAKENKEIPYAPNFTLSTLDGSSVTLSKLRGKPVMLTFWSINCPACQFQMPYLQTFYNEWSNEKIEMLTINVKDSAAAVLDFITRNGLDFPVLLDPGGRVAGAYGIPGVPVTFLIDAEGILKAYKIGAFQSRKQIEEALAQVFPSLTLTPKPKVAPEIGSIAPDFTLQTIYGQIVTLSTLRGKTVLLNFWTSTCPACIDELPYFQTVVDKRADNELAILAVNCGENNITVLSTVDSLRLSFSVSLDPDGDVCTTYGRGCPTTFLIDEEGIIRAIKDDAFKSPEEIESLLNSLK
jgi:peroxiredoxin